MSNSSSNGLGGVPQQQPMRARANTGTTALVGRRIPLFPPPTDLQPSGRVEKEVNINGGGGGVVPPPPPRSSQELFHRLVYFSHINRKTQYEHPMAAAIAARRRSQPTAAPTTNATTTKMAGLGGGISRSNGEAGPMGGKQPEEHHHQSKWSGVAGTPSESSEGASTTVEVAVDVPPVATTLLNKPAAAQLKSSSTTTPAATPSTPSTGLIAATAAQLTTAQSAAATPPQQQNGSSAALRSNGVVKQVAAMDKEEGHLTRTPPAAAAAATGEHNGSAVDGINGKLENGRGGAAGQMEEEGAVWQRGHHQLHKQPTAAATMAATTLAKGSGGGPCSSSSSSTASSSSSSTKQQFGTNGNNSCGKATITTATVMRRDVAALAAAENGHDGYAIYRSTKSYPAPRPTNLQIHDQQHHYHHNGYNNGGHVMEHGAVARNGVGVHGVNHTAATTAHTVYPGRNGDNYAVPARRDHSLPQQQPQYIKHHSQRQLYSSGQINGTGGGGGGAAPIYAPTYQQHHQSNGGSDVKNHKHPLPQSMGHYGVGAAIASNTPQLQHPYSFTTEPAKLRGELLTTRIQKGVNGLGFTLIGNDGTNIQPEFIQIKTVIPNGPAALNNTLHTGDVLVYVNNDCMLGATQDDACRVFRSIPVGEWVTVQVCRGYPLLLDPTRRIVTENVYSDGGGGAQSAAAAAQRYNGGGGGSRAKQRLEVEIRKGVHGFGFTITDSLQGQRVKSVLAPDHCPNLLEGDVIVEVDGLNTRYMAHSQLVQMLHDCPVGTEMRMAVLRHSSRQYRSRTPTAGFRYYPPPTTHDTAAASSGGEAPLFNGQLPSHVSTPSSMPGALQCNPIPNQRSRTPAPTSNGPSYLPASATGTWQRGANHYNAAPTTAAIPASNNPYARANNNNNSNSNGNYARTVGVSSASQLRPSSTTLGFSPTPNYMPLAAMLGPAHRQQYGAGADHRYQLTTVNLIRRADGFGFRLFGGKEVGTSLTVGAIIPRGAAQLDGRLMEGDELVEIDGRQVQNGMHEAAVELIKQAAAVGHVKLLVRRRRPATANGTATTPHYVPASQSNSHFDRLNSAASTLTRAGGIPISNYTDYPIAHNSGDYEDGGTMRLPYSNGDLHHHHSLTSISATNHPYYSAPTTAAAISPYDVRLMKTSADDELGCIIVSHQQRRYIGQVLPNTPADRSGQLQAGDCVLAINGLPVSNVTHAQVMQYVRAAGNALTLTIDPALRVPAAVLLPHLGQGGAGVGGSAQKALPASTQGTLTRSSPPRKQQHPQWRASSYGGEEVEAVRGNGGNEDHATTVGVELTRGVKGFGFSIRGGWEFDRMPLYVLRIADEGPAAEDGRLRVGDRIIEINGQSTVGMSHESAIQMIKERAHVQLVVTRQE